MENTFKVDGGVVGNFTPKCVMADLAGAATGDHSIGLKVPAGKIITAAFIKNLADDLTSSGSATIRLKVGSDAIGSAIGKASLKGTAVYVPITTESGGDTSPSAIVTTEETEVKVTVGTAAITTGKLLVGVLYI